MGGFIYFIIHELKTHTLVEVVEELLRGVKGFGGWIFLLYQIFYQIYFIQTYQVYFMKIYIWKRRKPASAKHRRIFLPIWFHSLPILPGSAAGAAALKSGDAVRWWWLSIALATRGRAGAADPPLKSFSLVGFSRFSGSGVDKKRVKFEDAFWRS